MSALVAGAAEVEVVPSFKGFVTGVDKESTRAANTASRSFNRGMDRSMNRPGIWKRTGSRMAGAIGGAFKTGLKVTAAGAVGLLGYALTKGFQRLSAIDDATHKLSGLGNSAKQTDAIMKNALTSVKGTAFGMDEAATTAAGAVAAGVKPGKSLTRTLSLTADAATIAGTSMGDMGAIFNKVATSNKIQGDTIAQLSDKGIPIVQLLGKSLGKSSAEVVDLAKKGKINFAQFQTAMQQGLGVAAKKSGDTFSGALANVKASLGRIGAGLLGGIFPQLAPGMKQLTAAMAPLEDKSKGLGTAIGKFLAKGLAKIPPIIAVVKDKWENLTLAWKTGINVDNGPLGVVEKSLSWLKTNVPAIAAKAKALFANFKAGNGTSKLGGTFKTIGNALQRIGKSINGDNIKELFDGLGKSAPILNSTLSITGVLLGFVADHAGLVAKFLPVLIAGFLAYKTAQAANNVVGAQSLIGSTLRTAAMFTNAAATRANARAIREQTAAQGQNTAATNTGIIATVRQRVASVAGAVAQRSMAAAQRVATAGQWLLNASFMGFPLVWLIVGLVALGAGLVLLWKKSDTFRRIVTGAFNAVKIAVAAVIDWFKGSFVPFFTKTIPGAFQSVLNFVKSHWKLILGLITGPIGSAVILVATHWSQIKGAFSKAWTWVKAVFSKSWNGLKTVLLAPVKAGQWWISHYIAAVKKVFTTAWSWASSVFRKSWNGWKSLLTGPITWAKNFIHTRIENIKTNFRNAWSWASGTFRKSWNGFKSLITKPITAARDAISSALGWGKNGLRSIFDKAVSGIGKIWSGLKKVMTTPLNSVMSLVEKFAHAVGKIPGLGSLKKITLPRFGAGGSVGHGGGRALPARRSGGPIPGPWQGPTADNVLGISSAGVPVAWVNPREEIIQYKSAQRMRQQFPGALEHINRHGTLPGFAKGGAPMSGKSWKWQWAQVKKQFPDAQLTSAYRPGARTAGDGAMSYHAIGRAIDVGGSGRTMAAVAKWIKANFLKGTHDLLYTPLWGNKGFYKGGWYPQHANTVAQHRNHVHWGLATAKELLGGRGGGVLSGLGAAKDWLTDKAFSVPKKIFESAMGKIPGGGMAGMMIKGFTGKIVDAVKNFVTGHADDGDMVGLGGSAPGSSLAAIATGKKMAAARGWTGRQWSSLYSLWNGESGWNPRAKNASSGAYGIPQALPGSKMASAGKDWMTNKATQIKWGLGYIGDRYGTPANAYAKWKARHPHWYGTGTPSARRGLNVVGDSGPELVLSPQVRRFRGGEQVLNPRQTQQALAGGNGQAPIHIEINGVQADNANDVARELLYTMNRRGVGKYAGV